MNPLMILWLWRIGGALMLAGSLTACYFGWAKHEQNLGAAPYIAAIEKQKSEAAKVLATESAKVAASNKALKDFKTKQEIQDVSNKKTVADLNANLHRLAGAAGRLRDPNQSGCGGGGSSAQSANSTGAVDSAGNPAETGGLFSANATGLLEKLTREADEVNTAYASCRADSFSIRSQP